jgi:hypothetical protein
MAFRSDIVVTVGDPPEIALVAEVKTQISDLAAAERQRKQYMLGMRCPTGLLVTPERLWIYRDRYTGYSEDSVELVGTFDISSTLGFRSAKSRGLAEIELEQTVQSWLERLSTEAVLDELPRDLREAVRVHLSPALSQGVVRAGHPRPALTG